MPHISSYPYRPLFLQEEKKAKEKETQEKHQKEMNHLAAIQREQARLRRVCCSCYVYRFHILLSHSHIYETRPSHAISLSIYLFPF